MLNRVEQALARHQHIRLSTISPDIWAGWYERFKVNAGLTRPGLVVDEDIEKGYFLQFAFQLGIPLDEVAAIFEYYRAGTSCGQVESVDSQVERVVESEVSE